MVLVSGVEHRLSCSRAWFRVQSAFWGSKAPSPELILGLMPDVAPEMEKNPALMTIYSLGTRKQLW